MMGHLVCGRYGPVETSSLSSKGWFRRVWRHMFGRRPALVHPKVG